MDEAFQTGTDEGPRGIEVRGGFETPISFEGVGANRVGIGLTTVLTRYLMMVCGCKHIDTLFVVQFLFREAKIVRV